MREPAFLGVAGLGLMTDRAHDVALIVDSVFHGFSADGQTFVLLSIDEVPALQATVEMNRVDANQHITDDGEAGYDIAPVFISAAKRKSLLTHGNSLIDNL